MKRRREDIAWLAGLIEGEGSLFITFRQDRQQRRAIISAEMVDRDVIEKLQTISQMGTVRPRKAHGLGKQERWVWRVERINEVYALTAAIFPFLGERRQAKARELLLALPPVDRRFNDNVPTKLAL